MDGGQLHRLGKRLIDLSRQVTGEPGDLSLTPGEAAVIEDVIAHPDSTVSEIGQRTGFVQSHVSASIARLRDRGVLGTAPDPADRRRTRVRLADEALVAGRAGRGVEDVLRRAAADATDAKRAKAILDELARILLR